MKTSDNPVSTLLFSEKIAIGFFVLCFFLGLYRLAGYATYEIPYGYDPGFFRHAIQTSLDALPYLPQTISPGLPYHEPLFGIIGTILTFIGYTPDTIIGPFLGFLSIFTAFCIYLLSKQTSTRIVGFFSASIFLISILQYQEYWWNYWRNILGIIFLLVSLGLMIRKSPGAIFTIAGLCTIHRPSALFFAVVLLFVLGTTWFREKKFPWKEMSLLLLGGLLALPLYINQMSFLTDMIEPITTTIGGAGRSGTFFQSREFFFLIFPYFLILIPSIFLKMERKEFDIVFIGFLTGLAWSILRLFFYNRMFVFFDIFAILLAGYSIAHIIRTYPRKIGYSLVILFFCIQGYLYTIHAHTYFGRHGISREEFDIVQNLAILTPIDATVLSTHRIYTPWILGYSQRTTLAPGLLDHQIWDESKWNQFYYKADNTMRCTMIEEYKSIAPKLYLFVGDQQPSLDLASHCFRPIVSNLSHPLLYEVIWNK